MVRAVFAETGAGGPASATAPSSSWSLWKGASQQEASPDRFTRSIPQDRQEDEGRPDPDKHQPFLIRWLIMKPYRKVTEILSDCLGLFYDVKHHAPGLLFQAMWSGYKGKSVEKRQDVEYLKGLGQHTGLNASGNKIYRNPRSGQGFQKYLPEYDKAIAPFYNGPVS